MNVCDLYNKETMDLPLTEDENKSSISYEYDSSDLGPINKSVSGLDACINGGNKILADSNLYSLLKSIYKNDDLSLKRTL